MCVEFTPRSAMPLAGRAIGVRHRRSVDLDSARALKTLRDDLDSPGECDMVGGRYRSQR
jgi:hypothetical protein